MTPESRAFEYALGLLVLRSRAMHDVGLGLPFDMTLLHHGRRPIN